MSTLVVRFSSVGDIVLTGAVTGALAPVRYLTLRRYAELARALPGVVEVLCWEDAPHLQADRVIDLHNSPRSRAGTRGLRPARVRRHDLQRRLRVAFKTKPAPRVIDRYAEAAGVAPSAGPWLDLPGPRDALVLCPGAQHATKRWAGFGPLGARWEGKKVVLGGPGEEERCRHVAEEAGAELLVGAPWPEVLQALGRARVVVGGDTGLMHLAGAAGLPLVAIFGPTHSEDGFWCHRGTVVELDLACRPCSRFGGEVCPVGDHLCMQGIGVERVWEAVLNEGAWR